MRQLCVLCGIFFLVTLLAACRSPLPPSWVGEPATEDLVNTAIPTPDELARTESAPEKWPNLARVPPKPLPTRTPEERKALIDTLVGDNPSS